MASSNEHHQFLPLSLVRSLWKLKLDIGVIWLLTTVGAVVVAYRLPAIYKAEALIQVEARAIPEKYVSSTVSADLQERLNKISQQILSSNCVLSVVEEFNLYPEERQTQPQEDIVRMVRRDLNISLEGRSGKDRPGAFRIAYQSADPATAARVANHIAGLFISENLRTREVQAVGTSEFLENQLAEAKSRLERQEAVLSEYKLKYNGELPQQETGLLTRLGQLQVQLQGVQDAINREDQNKLMLETTLTGARTSLEALAQDSAPAAGERVGANARSQAALPNLPSKAEQLRAELESLRLKYTEDHPDVRQARAELARVQRSDNNRPLAAPRGPTAPTPNLEPVRATRNSEVLVRERERVENLEAQLDAASKQLQALETDRQRILQNIGALQTRIEKMPIREQQLAAVLRDYEISKASYQSLLDKKLAADVAANMEKQQKPESFRLIDPAQAPEKPIKPDRPMLSVLGCVAGLFFGLALALVLQWKRNVVQGEWELPPGVPILGRIPAIIAGGGELSHVNPTTRGMKSRKWRLVVVSCSLLLALGVIIAGFYFRVTAEANNGREFRIIENFRRATGV